MFVAGVLSKSDRTFNRRRYALNIKRIPHQTKWVEYPDIKALYVQLGLKPGFTSPDGQPHYTLPVIHDPTTNTTICDSFKIVAYLDKTYPHTPTMLPAGSRALQTAFETAALSAFEASQAIVKPATHKILNTASQEYFWRTKGIGEMDPSRSKIDQWKQFEDGIGSVDGWLKENEGQKYVAGGTISFADVMLAARLLWIKKVFGDGGDEWQTVRSWHGGRWGALIDDLKQYEVVN